MIEMSGTVALGWLDFLLRNQGRNKHQQQFLLEQHFSLFEELQDQVHQCFSTHEQLCKYILVVSDSSNH